MQILIPVLIFLQTTAADSSKSTDYFLRNLNISLNDTVFFAGRVFKQHIRENAANNKINFTISGMHFENGNVTTKIRIPQTFTISQVIEQCALYYLMLAEEKRHKEHIQIYPFFSPIVEKPYAAASYTQNGKLQVHFHRWDAVPVPAKPDAYEAEIYNQIMDLSFGQGELLGPVDSEIFKQVGMQNKISAEAAIEIYKKVLLWQKSQ